ncbi:MAG: potassium-transporting ATPase ATP-binding subunit, partial [Ilumatobacteraceae bacterium]|nr:potassium-transporting ATPase ATP-binding subunit [Ilumatobacteraceae bacterium]
MTTTLQRPPKVRSKAPGSRSIFDPTIIRSATVDALKKLNPRTMMRNPVMFIVEIGSLLTT